MKPTQARAVLHSLTQGVDPKSGAELPQDAVTLRSDILRALFAAIAVMDQYEARAKRRALLPGCVGLPWTPEEEQELAAEFGAGEEVASIAEKHRRTVRAIETRLERLRLITAEQRTTRHLYSEGGEGGTG